jgi:hypothetical protein
MNGDHGAIAGRVVDATGLAVSGASVTISSGPAEHHDIAALTNAEGRFRLGELPPGRYVLAVHSDALPVPVAMVADVAAGQQAEVEIRLGGGQPQDRAATKLALVTDVIDWSEVRLVRLTLGSPDLQADVMNLFFSPASRASTVIDTEPGNYTYTVVFFMRDGLQRTIGPIVGNDRTLILDPHG